VVRFGGRVYGGYEVEAETELRRALVESGGCFGVNGQFAVHRTARGFV
jgi:hypothetical protein